MAIVIDAKLAYLVAILQTSLHLMVPFVTVTKKLKQKLGGNILMYVPYRCMSMFMKTFICVNMYVDLFVPKVCTMLFSETW